MKLTIKKFKRLENLELEIPAKISGGNGAGKTSILESISFCLTGKDLQGLEFKQVYDNRVDLHDAIADVTFTDKFGSTYQRIVQPIFQTSRNGEETIKVLRSTTCKINGITQNDYADQFADFQKFGTDYFFKQKEDSQRKIFIDALKSKLPEFDLQSKTLILKEKKSSANKMQFEIKNLQEIKKEFSAVAVPEFDRDLSKLNDEFLSLSKNDNTAEIAKINKLNNEAQTFYFAKKSELSENVSALKKSINSLNSDIFKLEHELERKRKEQLDTSEILELIEKLKLSEKELSELVYFDTLEDFAKNHFNDYPILSANAEKIKEIHQQKFDESEVTEVKCPNCSHILESNKDFLELEFVKKQEAEINAIKRENRAFLSAKMHDFNFDFLDKKKQIDSLKSQILDLEEKAKRFDSEKSTKIQSEKFEISELEKRLTSLNSDLEKSQKELSELKQPEILKLPELVEISDELKIAHAEFLALEKEINDAVAINSYNAKKQNEIEKKEIENRELLFNLDAEIVELENEISEYFSNLKGIVKTEFAGKIDLDVELLEYVITRGEYRDVFKITANGKVFPHECNGALQNNVKFQILAKLQRLNNYNGITIMDNCEANTTDKINTAGTTAIIAFATNDEKLNIE